MSAAGRIPIVAGTLSIGAAIAAFAASPSLRQTLAQYVGKSTVGNMWKALALVWAIVNIKNLPFMWHYRVFKGIFYHLYFQKRERGPRHLFAPMITSSYNSILDIDYNFHKSNSTYFADLDVARAHAVGSILRTGLMRLNKGDEEGLSPETLKAKGSYYIALGAVSCHFQREIPPMAGFEIWTRVLSWDRKWLYLVSHIVKKGAIKPEGFVLQPWKRGKKRAQVEGQEQPDLTKHIYATSIARYVLKKGRLTINPEAVLERSHLLPPRPDGVGLPPRAEGESSVVPTPAETHGNGELSSPESLAAQVTSKLNGAIEADNAQPTEDAEWTWDDMETERLRGLKLASHFDALNGLHGELRGGEALGQYSDWF